VKIERRSSGLQPQKIEKKLVCIRVARNSNLASVILHQGAPTLEFNPVNNCKMR
jgi:hypothetical protein